MPAVAGAATAGKAGSAAGEKYQEYHGHAEQQRRLQRKNDSGNLQLIRNLHDRLHSWLM